MLEPHGKWYPHCCITDGDTKGREGDLAKDLTARSQVSGLWALLPCDMGTADGGVRVLVQTLTMGMDRHTTFSSLLQVGIKAS